MYHFYSFENLNNEQAGIIPIQSVNKPFIEKGGFGAAVQLNVGFPL